jgi:multidrug efflux pump subunit AcrB
MFGGTINIMSLIGIVVMSGIIVNDSILKIDTINHLRREGMPLIESIKEGGHRRLKPIIMTSITTILALVPVIWGSGIGSELQKPLALTIIGGMVLGTIVSLYFIPLCYYYLYRKSVNNYQ